MNHDEVTTTVAAIARRVAKEPETTDGTFPMRVYARVRYEAPEVIDFLRSQRHGDPYQALKWFIPDDLGYSSS